MTRIRPKKKVRKISWRSGRIREDAAGMAALRSAAFHRSHGNCECALADPARRCRERVTWFDAHLHHIISRAHGGSDILENVAFVTRKCHHELTGVLKWSMPVLERWAG